MEALKERPAQRGRVKMTNWSDERFATKEEINRRFDEVDGKFEQVLFQLGRVNDRLDSYARVAFVTGVG